ncbi:hypothetical protein GQX74_004445 [Glossina fuscipes]|nr:hypothetical protein GQX74_004445 [Glossina fuscipes]
MIKWQQKYKNRKDLKLQQEKGDEATATTTTATITISSTVQSINEYKICQDDGIMKTATAAAAAIFWGKTKKTTVQLNILESCEYETFNNGTLSSNGMIFEKEYIFNSHPYSYTCIYALLAHPNSFLRTLSPSNEPVA